MIADVARKVAAHSKAADQSNIAKTALKGMDVAEGAVETVGKGVFWLKATALTFALFCVLLITDIVVHIVK